MSDNVLAVLGSELAESRRATAEFIAAAKADATRRAYAADWRDFKFWCASHDLDALPATPENVAVYLSSLAGLGRKLSTIRRRCAAIAHFHQAAGHESPASHTGVRATLSGIARKTGRGRGGQAGLSVFCARLFQSPRPDREGKSARGRSRPESVLRTQPAIRLHHIGRRCGRIAAIDRGPRGAREARYDARIRAGRRRFLRSQRQEVPLIFDEPPRI